MGLKFEENDDEYKKNDVYFFFSFMGLFYLKNKII